ncbi:unnamed protein product [Trichogramma brassicae]|uniref:Uncharacterized protein n=1 Tax=Trichogramma brassicae TaxID=86971 RepID=A0A6H5IH95_9HYME|nr:unnamed protein product [Trichogramma brassicae]
MYGTSSRRRYDDEVRAKFCIAKKESTFSYNSTDRRHSVIHAQTEHAHAYAVINHRMDSYVQQPLYPIRIDRTRRPSTGRNNAPTRMRQRHRLPALPHDYHCRAKIPRLVVVVLCAVLLLSVNDVSAEDARDEPVDESFTVNDGHEVTEKISPIENIQTLTIKQENSVMSELIRDWAPLVWLAPGERFLPLGVPEFLDNMQADDDYLKTRLSLREYMQ